MRSLTNNFLGKLLLIISVITFSFNVSLAQGDDPCTAQALTVNTSCTYANYNYASSATGSTGIPEPDCAN